MTDRPNRILEISELELNSVQRKVFDDLVAGRGRLRRPLQEQIHSPEAAPVCTGVLLSLMRTGVARHGKKLSPGLSRRAMSRSVRLNE